MYLLSTEVEIYCLLQIMFIWRRPIQTSLHKDIKNMSWKEAEIKFLMLWLNVYTHQIWRRNFFRIYHINPSGAQNIPCGTMSSAAIILEIWNKEALAFNADITVLRNDKHIEAKTKLPPFRRQHFQVNFLEWKFLHLNYNLIEICSLGSNWQ